MLKPLHDGRPLFDLPSLHRPSWPRRFASATVAATLFTTALVPTQLTACAASECRSWCELYVSCYAEDLDEDDCGYDDDLAAVIDECEMSCESARAGLDDGENEEVSACYACLHAEIGTPDQCSDGDFAEALDDCDDECDEDGVDEFGEDFSDEFEPDVECEQDACVLASAVCGAPPDENLSCTGDAECLSVCIVENNSCHEDTLIACVESCGL